MFTGGGVRFHTAVGAYYISVHFHSIHRWWTKMKQNSKLQRPVLKKVCASLGNFVFVFFFLQGPRAVMNTPEYDLNTDWAHKYSYQVYHTYSIHLVVSYLQCYNPRSHSWRFFILQFKNIIKLLGNKQDKKLPLKIVAIRSSHLPVLYQVY